MGSLNLFSKYSRNVLKRSLETKNRSLRFQTHICLFLLYLISIIFVWKCLWKIAGLMEDLFLGSQWSIILGYRRLSVKFLFTSLFLLPFFLSLHYISNNLFIFRIFMIPTLIACL